jgi:fructose-1,6-bisphosphatase/inositol monophosphatase family enzyme
MGGVISPGEFVEVLFPALRQAAAIARALEGRVSNRPKAGERRPAKAALTLADTAAQEALLVPLFERFPEVSLDAEEDTPTAARFPRAAPARVVVDPIDGTLHSFLLREGPYAVLVGLALHGRYEAALVALPREELFFEALRGAGARVAHGGADRRPARAARAARDGARVLVSHGLPDAVRARLVERDLEPVPASGGAIAVAPLLPGVRAGLRLAPMGSISVRGRVGALIGREAGARVCRQDGAPFPDTLDAPAEALLVAPDDETLDDLRFALRVGA